MVIAFTNHDGGNGKTKSIVSLGTSLGKSGKRILLIDLDPQGHLTYSLDCFHHHHVISCVLLEKCDVQKAIQRNEFFDLIPGNITTMDLNDFYSKDSKNLFKLKNLLSSIDKNYDFIFLDCSSDFLYILKSVLIASDYLVIPLQLETISVKAKLKATEYITKLKNKYNPKLEILNVLYTTGQENYIHSLIQPEQFLVKQFHSIQSLKQPANPSESYLDNIHLKLQQRLSVREMEVLECIAKGFTNKEIAEKIHLSVRTIDSHRSNIQEKLRAKNTADLVRIFYTGV
jgi:chromosome partitioning protein